MKKVISWSLSVLSTLLFISSLIVLNKGDAQ